jgi:hypothetical protein
VNSRLLRDHFNVLVLSAIRCLDDGLHGISDDMKIGHDLAAFGGDEAAAEPGPRSNQDNGGDCGLGDLRRRQIWGERLALSRDGLARRFVAAELRFELTGALARGAALGLSGRFRIFLEQGEHGGAISSWSFAARRPRG